MLELLVLSRRLEKYVEKIFRDYQIGFRRRRPTTDYIFTIRCILEKCNEYNIRVYQLFIDYQQAYNSVGRSFFYNTMEMLGIPKKLMRQMTLINASNKVKVTGEPSQDFPI